MFLYTYLASYGYIRAKHLRGLRDVPYAVFDGVPRDDEARDAFFWSGNLRELSSCAALVVFPGEDVS